MKYSFHNLPHYLILWLMLAMLSLTACRPIDAELSQSTPIINTQSDATVATTGPTANLTEGCVETYDPNIDYFPEKAKVTQAAGLSIDYFKHYKVVTVLTPWRDAETSFQYVLVQCGTPAPEGFAEAQIINVPINSVITMSSTQLPHLDLLGLLDRLLGHDSFAFVNTAGVIERIEAGKIAEIGWGSTVNVELVLDLNPDLIMTYGLGNPEQDAHPKLLEAGLKVGLNAEYMETSPLGRAEWLKFMAVFFNEEGQAEAIFADMVKAYESMVAKTQTIAEKPTVFVGSNYGDVWNVAGGHSYFAQFLADAGTRYLWADDESTGSIPLDFEVVFDQASQADYWLLTSIWGGLEAMLAADERYADFAAWQHGRIYNNNARVNENGGNDYWESGLAKPHLILADLIKIFHPELLPEHELIYYQKLE